MMCVCVCVCLCLCLSMSVCACVHADMYVLHVQCYTLTESKQSGQYQSPAGTSSRFGCNNIQYNYIKVSVTECTQQIQWNILILRCPYSYMYNHSTITLMTTLFNYLYTSNKLAYRTTVGVSSFVTAITEKQQWLIVTSPALRAKYLCCWLLPCNDLFVQQVHTHC